MRSCFCERKMSSDSYPEYLNPFAEDLKPKPKLTIRNSFKELKRSLRQSFRIKKKDEPEVILRQKDDSFRRLPASYSVQPTALPRSRFHERVTKCDYSTRSVPGPNPFEEEDSEPKTIRRRWKKRAPLPPPNKSISSQNINEEQLDTSGGSHWSLTSVGTDYSSSVDTRSNNQDFENESIRDEMVDKFIDFNKNMEKLKEDDNNNNNNVTDEEKCEKKTEISNNNIPDLVVSCPSEVQEEVKENKVSEEEETKSEPKSENNDISDCDKSELENKEPAECDTKNESISEHNPSQEENKTDDEILDINQNEPFLYHERKSIFIADSKEELNDESYTGRVSLYITGSCDDLDSGKCTENITDENSNNEEIPTPKQRKNKLTKNILLGI